MSAITARGLNTLPAISAVTAGIIAMQLNNNSTIGKLTVLDRCLSMISKINGPAG
ncbi:MAG: hypothetical protein BWY71_02242 [Planctomycetes bacterium ADurb.Bin412]|nr:MAG: hypothetical protein BWY71_02242 [Planctomycetes bacterium ADurb.Bin412]